MQVNITILSTASYNYGLDESEFYDVAILGYLLAVQEYLEKPELSYLSFTTVAWRNMRFSVMGEFTYHNRPKRKAPMVDYHENLSSPTLDELLPDRMQSLAESLDNQEKLLQLLAYLTPKEKEVVHLKAVGYTHRGIANQLQLTTYGVDSRLQRLRKRLRGFALI